MRRVAGVVVRPRATLVAVSNAPAWLATWSVILILWAICGGVLLATAVGRQALVDERVRVVESLGGTVSDPEYAALQADPPLWVYFTSGGRALLAPPTTVLAAVVLLVVARRDGARANLTQALALAVHASVVLVIGQIVATPINYTREALTSPLNLAAMLPFVESGTVPARFFGTIDVFAVWWAGLLAVSASVLTGRRTMRYAGPLAGLYVAFAAIAAALVAVMGGA